MTDKLSSAEPNEGSTAQRGCCAGVDHSLSDRDLEVDVETLAAVGSETRYGALRLVAASEGGTCGCELEPALGVSQGAVSQALSRLYDAGAPHAAQGGSLAVLRRDRASRTTAGAPRRDAISR